MFSRDICDPCLLWTWVCSEAFKPELGCWQMLLLNLDAYLGAGQYMLLCFCFSHGSFSLISSSIPFLPFLFSFLFWVEIIYPPMSVSIVLEHRRQYTSHPLALMTSPCWGLCDKFSSTRFEMEDAETWVVQESLSKSPWLGCDEAETSAVFRPAMGIVLMLNLCSGTADKCQQRYALLNSRDNLIPEPKWGKKKPSY